MEPLTPSFHTLYLQSRPRQHDAESKVMEQRERYAVACLAFTLRHDVCFRAGFLDKVCEYRGPNAAENFEVTVEIEKCGDLALEAPGEVAFVIECKIDAPFQPNQNPNQEDEFRSGYRQGILRKYGNVKSKAYITLRQDAGVSYPLCDVIPCIAKTWRDVRDCGGNSTIVSDLFKSLGSFHVRCFAIFNPMTDKLNCASDFLVACKVQAILKDVAAYLKDSAGLPSTDDDSELKTPDSGYVGRGITRKNVDPKWIDFIAPKAGSNADQIGWFGYGDGKLSVWFYCAPGKSEHVQEAIKTCTGSLGKVDMKDNCVWISANSEPAAGDKQWLGDKEWFKQVYDCLCGHIGLHK